MLEAASELRLSLVLAITLAARWFELKPDWPSLARAGFHSEARLRHVLIFVLIGGLTIPTTWPRASLARREAKLHLELATPQKHPEFVPGEILVRFREGAAATKSKLTYLVTPDSRQISIRIEHLGVEDSVPGLRLARVAQAETLTAIAALQQRPDVVYAEPNYLLYQDATPNDPRYPEMYSLNNTGQTGGVVGADIDGDLAWNLTTGSDNVVVGVVDTGIDIEHPDLKPNIWINSGEVANNGIDDDANGYVDDVNGWDFYNQDKTVFDSPSIDNHGTHVAGTIGAVGNNSQGVVGINWQVKLLPLKFLGSSSGSGPTSAAVAAINYARQMAARGVNIRVLNNSWGGGSRSQALLDAITSLNSAGILFVVAAGNRASDILTVPHYPANHDVSNLLSVASTNSSDALSGFSNFGSRMVKMAAPGSSVLSTTAGGNYGFLSGTSMATPHVSGVAALALAAAPHTSLQRLVGSLVYSGDSLFSLQDKTITGKRLNAFKTLQTIQENDQIAPGGPTDFRIEYQGGRTISLYWNASGDDGALGTASDYDVFFVDLEDGFRTMLAANAVPGPPGTAQSLINIRVPFRSVNASIELRAYDNAGNFSTTSATVVLDAYAADPYVVTLSPATGLSTGGERLPLNGDDQYVSRSLDYDRGFFGGSGNLTISTNGAIYFTDPPRRSDGTAGDLPSSVSALNANSMLAGLWEDLVIDETARPGDGVFEVKPNPETVIYRWEGVTFEAPNTPVRFEIELQRDTTVIFRYGPGNTNLFPIVGVGLGEPRAYLVESHSSERFFSPFRKSLSNAQTVTFTRRPAPIASTIELSSSSYEVSEAAGSIQVSVMRPPQAPNGFPILGTFTVAYSTVNGTAMAGADFVGTTGTLAFAVGEALKTISIPIINDTELDPLETFQIVLTNPSSGAQIGNIGAAAITIIDDDLPNAIDEPRSFIRQQYLDFLNREPDPGGWDYWTSGITECGNDLRCIHNRRIDVSAAFFIELEFQETGYVVYRMHRAAFGTLPSGPTRANVLFAQFMTDRGQLVAGPGLAQSTISFANAFVQRPEFLQSYPNHLTNEQFVQALFDSANLTPFTNERQQQIAAMNNGKTRAEVLLDLIEVPAFKTREYNGAFVLMQYFGYLRRDPDQAGYDFWLGVLNNQELNNYRGMVCAFLTSPEYQRRFGPTITRTDRDCGQ